MKHILDTPSAATLDDLKLLCDDLDLKIPPKVLDKNLLIATWNIRGFGDITEKEKSLAKDSPKRDFQ